MDEPVADLELSRFEYVCDVCHLVHHRPAGRAACDMQ